MMSVPRLLAVATVFYEYIFHYGSYPKTFGSPNLQSDAAICPWLSLYGDRSLFFSGFSFWDSPVCRKEIIVVRLCTEQLLYFKDHVSALENMINIKLFNPISTYGRLSNVMSGVQHNIMLKLSSTVIVYIHNVESFS